MSPKRSLLWAIILLVVLAAASGWWAFGRRTPASFDTVPESFPPTFPAQPLAEMEVCESYTEEVVRELVRQAGHLEEGRFAEFGSILTTDFRGHSLASLQVIAEDGGPLQSFRTSYDLGSVREVDREGFLRGLESALGAWESRDCVQWIVHRADFEAGRPTWGRLEQELFVRGRDAQGRVRSISAVASAQWVNDRGRWVMRGFHLDDASSWFRAQPLFTEVTEEAGVAFRDAPFDGYHLWNGAASGDCNGDGLWDLFVPSKSRSFLYLALDSGGFEEVSADWGLRGPGGGTGAVFFDCDNDGDQDLAVAGEGFRRKDGEVEGNPLRLYRNEGERFREVTEEYGLGQLMNSYSIITLDYDLDGYLDLFVCNYGRFSREFNNAWNGATNAQPNALYRNLAGHGFEDVAVLAGADDSRWSFAAAAADFDRDGDQDLYVANDFGRNALLSNQGDGTFVDISREGTTRDLGYGMSASWADLNNDGLLDLYVANMGIPVARRILSRLDPSVPGIDEMVKMARGNTMLFQQDGEFVHAPDDFGGIDGAWAWACVPFDLDLDGRLDIFCTNGYITREGRGDANSYYWQHVIASSIEAEMEPSIRIRQQANNPAFTAGLNRLGQERLSFSGWERDKLWINLGEEGFLDISDVSGVDAIGDGRAAISADFDDDGDVDLFLHEMQLERHHLFRNDVAPNPHGFLKIQLRATSTQYQAVGAEVIVRTPERTCSQVMSLGTSYMSCNPPELIFGLAGAEQAEVEVVWPGCEPELFGTIVADSRVLLEEGVGAPSAFPPRPRALTLGEN